MSPSAVRSRPAAVATCLALASLLSCGREVTGPGGAGRRVEVGFNPVFETIRLGGDGRVMSIADVVNFTRVRVVMLRTNGDTAVDRLVDFPAESTTVSLAVSVTLSQAATSEGEPLEATLKYIDATGDTVFTGGPAAVVAKASGGSTTPPPDIPVRYTGSGADAASIVLSPATFTGTINQQTGFTATVRDSSGATMTAVPVAFTSTDSNTVRVNLRTGQATLVGARGSVSLIAQTLTGQADTADVTITPTPSAIVLVSGGAQSVRQGGTFAQPVRVRVNAVDGLPVSGVPVTFAATRGQGSASPAIDTTDASGIAEATWTAGDSAGIGNLTATVLGTSLTLVVPGTQLSSAPTAITWETVPAGVPAGASLAEQRVVVRDATGDTVRAFNGTVALSLTGGTAGASLLGATSAAAVNGVATFTEVAIDRDGANYRLVASVAGGPSAQSAPFTITPSLPADLVLVSGDRQTVPPSTALPDSIVVRVLDVLGAGKAGVTVTFGVSSGGGSVSPTSVATDVSGRAAARWTTGPSGPQGLAVTSGQLTPLTVTATVTAPGGPPVLFLPVDTFTVAAGRARDATIFLTNPTPGPLVVTLAMQGTAAQFDSATVTIPSGGSQVIARVVGVENGTTQAVVSSAAGSDSMIVIVSPATATLGSGSQVNAALTDTIRVPVFLNLPAPAGGVTVTVRSTDSSAVLIAPGSGRGATESACYQCAWLDAPEPTLAPGGTVARLLAPPAGTAFVTIPEGQQLGHLVILPVGLGGEPGTPVPLTVDAPGMQGIGLSVAPVEVRLSAYCYYCVVAPGLIERVYVTIDEELRRDAPIRIRSLDTSILTVRDSSAMIARGDFYIYDYVDLAAVDTGIARIVVSSPGLVDDTLEIPVLPPRLGLTNGVGSIPLEEGGQTVVNVTFGLDQAGSFVSGLALVSPRTASILARTPGIIAFERSTITTAQNDYRAQFILDGLAAGTTWIVYSSPGWATDSIEVVVTRAPLGASNAGQTIGVGQRDDVVLLTVGTSAVSGPTPVSVTSSDPSVLRVLTPTVYAATGTLQVPASVEGVSVGTATLTFVSPGRDTSTLVMNVLTPTLDFATFTSPSSLTADSASFGVSVLTGAGGRAEYTADTLIATIRSTDPAALLVTDSLVRFVPGNWLGIGGIVRAIAPGTARLVVSAPGYTPDTSALLTVLPFRLNVTPLLTLGTGLRATFNVQRLSPAGAALPVTLSIQGTGGSTLTQPTATITAGVAAVQVVLTAGATIGRDTVIVSAPGHAPDTMFVNLVRPRLNIEPGFNLFMGEPDYAFDAYQLTPGGLTAEAGAPRRFIVTSRDSTVLSVVQDTIAFAPGDFLAGRLATLRPQRPGRAWVVATSLDGSVDADSGLVNVVAPLLYHGNSTSWAIGTNQRTYSGEQYVGIAALRPDSLWVRLTSSLPSLVQVPDSVLILPGTYYSYYDIASGDSVGSATVTMSAAGYANAQMTVFVTRMSFFVDFNEYTMVGGSGDVTVEAYSEGYRREMTAPVPFRLVVGDTSIAQTTVTTASIPIGTNYIEIPRTLFARKAGITSVGVEDTRTTGITAVSHARDLLVQRGTVTFDERRYEVSPGLVLENSTRVVAEYPPDSAWVRVRTLNGRAAVMQDSVLLLQDNYGYYGLYGVSPGLDTLVLESPALGAVDTVVVSVGSGIVATLAPVPAGVRQGDSLAVDVVIKAPTGVVGSAATAPISITFTPPPSLDVRVGGVTVTSVQLGVGQSQVRVWLRGLTPGSGTLTMTAPGMNPARVTITTRSP